jgi:hypothetical protein
VCVLIIHSLSHTHTQSKKYNSFLKQRAVSLISTGFTTIMLYALQAAIVVMTQVVSSTWVRVCVCVCVCVSAHDFTQMLCLMISLSLCVCTQGIKKSCSDVDKQAVQVGAVISVIFIVIFIYLAVLLFAGAELDNKTRKEGV